MEEIDRQRVDAGLPVLKAAEFIEHVDEQRQVVVKVVGHHVPLGIGLGVGDKLVFREVVVGIEVALELPHLLVPLAGMDGIFVGILGLQDIGGNDDSLKFHLVQGEGLRAEHMGRGHLLQKRLYAASRRLGGEGQKHQQKRCQEGNFPMRKDLFHGQSSVAGASITS